MNVPATIVLALVVATAAVEPSISVRQKCLNYVANYLAATEIDGAVEGLLEISRTFYPDVLDLIDAEVPSEEYLDALRKKGVQAGCEAIESRLKQLPEEVPCYNQLEDEDQATLISAILEANAAATPVVEARFACAFADFDLESINLADEAPVADVAETEAA